jgi:hypothetical protein
MPAAEQLVELVPADQAERQALYAEFMAEVLGSADGQPGDEVVCFVVDPSDPYGRRVAEAVLRAGGQTPEQVRLMLAVTAGGILQTVAPLARVVPELAFIDTKLASTVRFPRTPEMYLVVVAAHGGYSGFMARRAPR